MEDRSTVLQCLFNQTSSRSSNTVLNVTSNHRTKSPLDEQRSPPTAEGGRVLIHCPTFSQSMNFMQGAVKPDWPKCEVFQGHFWIPPAKQTDIQTHTHTHTHTHKKKSTKKPHIFGLLLLNPNVCVCVWCACVSVYACKCTLRMRKRAQNNKR